MCHPEFTIVIRIKGDFPSVAELKMIRKLDETVADVPIVELKKRICNEGVHHIDGLIKLYLNVVVNELDKYEISYLVE
ncbi:hypothetical protein [Spartinivicinus poritis]|uniref:Uncharacterized protein n=1 Tax=Spartinivicinus poritis TaxID=2994640 RepID=A0ABT5UGX0_9GAMM|nr:hypothetical protein [Spartinivicinus sp. A2-2]MDE1465557.1 hypothetical protein [Spartinivicinus sp. A2-2]